MMTAVATERAIELQIALEFDLRSVVLARDFVRSALAERQMGSRATADAELLVSELVTNAIVHAGSEPVLTVRIDNERARIGVIDCSPEQPRVRTVEFEATSGRGMFLVDTLATRWGVTPVAGGKQVWFELS